MTSQVTRVPITGIARTPIVGIKRTPIITGATTTREELQWDDIYTSLVNYIKFAAKQVSSQSNNSTLHSAEDLFQEGQLLLYHCFNLYKHKDVNEFKALFKSSLWRRLRDLGGRKAHIQVDIEDAFDVGYTDSVVEDLYNEQKLQQVADMLASSPIALTIFKEFVNSSKRTLWEAEMDIARRMTLKDQNFKVSIPSTVIVKGVHIQRAMELSKGKFNEQFKLVKDCVAKVYSQSNITDEQTEELLQSCS